MGEALAAVGTAATILQLVDFSSKLLSTAWRLYKKRGDLSAPDSETELLALDSRALLLKIQDDPTITIHQELRLCISTCSNLLNELMQILDSLKPDPKKNSMTELLSRSWKRPRVDGKLKSLEERIGRLKRQICEHINIIIIKDLYKPTTSNSFQPNFKAYFASLTNQISNLAVSRPWEAKEAEALFTSFLEKVNELHQRTQDCERIQSVLRSLHFPQIKERISDVPTAHKDTFQWVFGETPKTNLAEWLRQDRSGCYWVSGQAGSGKSTLMKFIIDNDNTHTVLREWAKPYPIIVASHFFWSAGTRIQKSQQGLFRTLLFQILLQVPEVTKTLCPAWWDETSFDHLEWWTLSRLFETFQKLAEWPNFSHRISIFVDGLDEYHGDHKVLISVLDQLSQSPHIKICASSRPWIHFRNAWDNNRWKIVLQDLTGDDIQRYVRDRFTAYEPPPSHPSLDIPSKSQIDNLALEICQRAQGVFLWVFLVTRSLLEGLDNGDGMTYLLKRLQDLPSDLEEYFKLMFDSIDKVYWQRTSRVFKCLLQHGTALPLLVFHYICLEEDDPEYALKPQVEMTDADGEVLLQSRQRNLIAQCKDLLRTYESKKGCVVLRVGFGFLHRTVFDFLRTASMSQWLDSKTGNDFSPHRTLSMALFAIVKTTPTSWIRDETITPREHQYLVLPIIHYALELEIIQGQADTAILDELVDLSSSYPDLDWLSPYCKSIIELIFRCGLHKYQILLATRGTSAQVSTMNHQKRATAGMKKKEFLNSATSDPFLREWLPEENENPAEGRDLRHRRQFHKFSQPTEPDAALGERDAQAYSSLEKGDYLHMALKKKLLIQADEGFDLREDHMIDLEAVENLLKSGISPNSTMEKGTVWSEFVGSLRRRRQKDNAVEACRLLVAFGADKFIKGDRGARSAERGIEKALSPVELRALGTLKFQSLGPIPRNEKRRSGGRSAQQLEMMRPSTLKTVTRDVSDPDTESGIEDDEFELPKTNWDELGVSFSSLT